MNEAAYDSMNEAAYDSMNEAAAVHMQTLEAEAHAPQSSHQITELL